MALPDQDQRTLPASPKRIREFKERGEVARSRDLTMAGAVAGGAGGILFFASSSAHALVQMMHDSLRDVGAGALSGVSGAHTFVSIAAPSLVGALAGCVVTGAAQLGMPPTLNTPSFDLTRLFNPEAVTALVSPKALAGRALLSIAKVAAVLGAAYVAIRAAESGFAARYSGAADVASTLGGLIRRVGAFAGGALVVLALVEYVLEKRKLNAKMRMTPEEARREHKDTEGDPQVKRRRRQRMRELAKRRLKQAVLSADVILVNPTEYAVALRYRSGDDRAPRVVAKGRGAVAERIREMARGAGIPIVAQPPLTRLIHKLVKEGREIPSSLYQAVAEILAYVYKLRGAGAR